MELGTKIKKYREGQNLSQDELALKILVSRQTISNWETNKSCPDIQSLVMLCNVFHISLDDFIKEDITEMRDRIDQGKVKRFNVMGYIFAAELLLVMASAYPLFRLEGNIGIIIWLLIFLITFGTAFVIERFKKNNDIQTYKEIVAFVDGKQLTHDEAQQEIGKRMYQKIFAAILAGVIALIVCLVTAFIVNHVM